jgi:hypothetical protein
MQILPQNILGFPNTLVAFHPKLPHGYGSSGAIPLDCYSFLPGHSASVCVRERVQSRHEVYIYIDTFCRLCIPTQRTTIICIDGYVLLSHQTTTYIIHVFLCLSNVIRHLFCRLLSFLLQQRGHFLLEMREFSMRDTRA